MPPAVWVPAVLLTAAAIPDLRKREIPDVFPLALLAWAVLARALGFQEPDWWGLPLGLGVGALVGTLFFALGAMGGGDAKILAALGAILGPLGFLIVMAFIAVVGGAWALYGRLRGQREIPYGPAIALGYIAAVLVLKAVQSG